VENLETTKKTG